MRAFCWFLHMATFKSYEIGFSVPFFYSSRDSVPPHMINSFSTVGPTILLGSEQCVGQPYS